MKFKIKFLARLAGALGVRSQYTRTVKADTLDDATISLYDEFEHITILEVNGIKFSYSI